MSPVPPDGCPRTTEVGAYLLGSLTPDERTGYAAHLAHCPDCLRETGQLAGLPGLLSRAPGGSANAPAQATTRPTRATRSVEQSSPTGPGAVTGALAEIRHRRTRQRAGMAAALLLVAVVGVGATSVLSRGGGGVADPATGVSAAAQLPVQMQSTAGSEVTAAVELTPRPWGTQVVMRCRYQGNHSATGTDHQAPVYVLVARGVDGTSTQLARWTAIPDQNIVLATATELTGQQLAGLEVRNLKGKVMLRTDHV